MGVLALNGGKPVRTAPFPVWPHAGAEERVWLERVLEGQRWFAGALGDDPEALGTLFGRRFAEFVGVRHALPVANGSVSLEIALRALRIGPGDEVIVPAYTYVSTGTSVLMVGAIPVFADMERASYCLDPDDAERKITPRTRAIIAVHLYGHPADMDPLRDLADQRLALVVERHHGRRRPCSFLIRDDLDLERMTIKQLQAGKQEVKDVEQGTECGLKVDGKIDIIVGDTLQIYREEKVEKKIK